MGKTKNIKKSAAAAAKSIRAVAMAVKAMADGADVFMSVQSAKGNGNFILKTSKGKEVRAGRISRGLRISVGQIVVTEGDHSLGVEVTGVITDRHEAEQLVRTGKMPAEVLAAAVAVGSIETGASADLDDLFEPATSYSGVALGSSMGGEGRSLRDQRAMAATEGAIAARVATLLGGGGGGASAGAEVGEIDLEDL